MKKRGATVCTIEKTNTIQGMVKAKTLTSSPHPVYNEKMKVTIQQHPILRRSGRLTYPMYASPSRLPQPEALLNSYGLVVCVISGIKLDSYK
jgi:hypothetical protein